MKNDAKTGQKSDPNPQVGHGAVTQSKAGLVTGPAAFWKKRRNRWLVFGGAILLVAVAAIVIMILLTRSPQQPPQPTMPTFADLQQGHPDQQAVVAVIGFGLLQPQADGTFQPDGAISRVEFVGILDRIFRLSGNRSLQPSYVDVLPNHPHYAQVEAVRDLFGWQSDRTDQSFFPDQPISRQEAARILARLLELPADSVQTLADYLQLSADDPIRMTTDHVLTRLDAARIFYKLILARQPSPAPSFQIKGIR